MENKKLVSLESLLILLSEYRKQGKKIVFTNGCFDILHKGHVAYLQQARDLGDILIVGLNSDSSVKKIKGPDRPINNQEDRAFVLGGLAAIDHLVIFTEPTPYEILSKIKPDILVKGGDYKIEEVIGAEFARETCLIDFVEGYSTTRIIHKLQS